jgi:spore coat polysaccharide biosynthesis predicted glycosyltransferase SpsG
MMTPVHSDPTLFASLAGGYQTVTDGMPCDLIVNDMLDTTEEQMFELRFRAPVVALEDIGPGAQHASLLVNELYPAHAPAELSGPKWAVLRPVFTAAPEHTFGHAGPPRLLVTFGGTDPAGLTVRLRRIVNSLDADSVIVDPPSRGGGADIASLLTWADLVVCSGGRTVWEAMACGTPAVVLCQNSRELSHSHLSPLYGVLNLGLGALVSDGKIDETIRFLLQATGFLADMSGQMRGVVDGRGALRIAHRIEGLLGGL